MRRIFLVCLLLVAIAASLILRSLGPTEKPKLDPETARVLTGIFERHDALKKRIDEAISEIEQLGGVVTRKYDGGPVTGISMNGESFGNDQLRLIQSFSDLTTLELKCPEFDDDGLKELASHVSLEGLRIGSPKFTGKGLISVATIPNLNFVELASCSGITDDDLKTLKHLRSLWLVGETVTDSTLIALKDFNSLQTLWLNSRNISDEGLRVLPHFPRLVQVILSHCHKLTESGTEIVCSLPNLKTLKLAGHYTTNDHLNEIAKIQPLEFLELEPCRDSMPEGLPITDEGLRVLSELPQLKKCYLHRCPDITDASVPLLSSLVGLTKLMLDETGISEAGVANLRKALPKTDITYMPFDGPRFYRPDDYELIRKIQKKGALFHGKVPSRVLRLPTSGYGMTATLAIRIWNR